MSNFNALIIEATNLLNNATTEADFSRVEDIIEDLWDCNTAGNDIKAITDVEDLLVDQWQIFKDSIAQSGVAEIVVEEEEDDCIPSFTDSLKATLAAQSEAPTEETIVVVEESAPSIPFTPETALPSQGQTHLSGAVAQETADTQTNRTNGMIIKITASQRRVIALLLDNPRFDVRGNVDLKKASVKVDEEAQASLISLLEEMATFNPRSFAALVEKISEATPMTPATPAPVEVVKAPIVTDEVENVVASERAARLQEEIVAQQETDSYLGGFKTAAKRASWGFKDAPAKTTSTNPWGTPNRKTTFVSNTEDTAQPIPTMKDIDLDLI